MTGNNVRVHAVISGRVQGVCFRLETKRAAQKIGGVSGWVRNKRDWTVEAVFEGEENKVIEMLEWCKKGPSMAAVKDVDVAWEDYSGEFNSFEITH
jgi:acylphosphatase